MIKLHCDICDKVIDGFYWNVERSNVSEMVRIVAANTPRNAKSICDECFSKILPCDERSDKE